MKLPLAVATSLLVACAHEGGASPPGGSPSTNAPVAPAVVVTQALVRVRLCTFRGHHGFPGLTVALEDSCGERSATCNVVAPANGTVTEIDVRVEVTAWSDATCSDRGTRVTSTCVLPATSGVAPNGRYSTGSSRLAPRSVIDVRVNGEHAGKLRTDAAGSPEPAEQCWSVEATERR